MKVFVTILLVFAGSIVYAQYDPNYKKSKDYAIADEDPSPVDFGIGLGLSYGGIGGRVAIFPIPNLGVFGGVGYNFLKAGYNVGIITRILPRKKVCPLLIGMYGYNGVIFIANTDQYNKVYYGPTFGGGTEIRFKNNQSFLNLELLIPIRSQEWRNDIDALLSNPTIEMTEPLPFTISVGYHFKF